MLVYKGYIGNAVYDPIAKKYRGEIAGLTPKIFFESTTENSLETAFKSCVEDYLVALRGKNYEEAPFIDYWTPEKYVEHSALQLKRAKLLLEYIPAFKGNEKILDVGCGDGRITAEIASRIPNGTIHGVDISESMINFANKTYPHDRYPNLSYSVKDAKDIEYGEEEFDVIFSFTALQFLRNHEIFLKEAYKSLKPSGYLVITMPTALPPSLQTAVNELISSPEWSSYFHEFPSGYYHVDEKLYKKLLIDTHFDLMRYAEVQLTDVFPSRAAFEGFVSQVSPYVGKLSEDLSKKFLKQLVDRYLELEPKRSRGEVYYVTNLIEVFAKKP